MLSIAGDSIGKILSTPTVPDILRTVKRFLSPWPAILITTPRYNCTRSLLPSMIRYATVTVSPALKLGCCLPVANASSAILIKSIVAIIKLFYRYNATYQVSLLLTAIARKRCKVTNYLSDSQMFWRKWSAGSWYRMFLGLHQTNVAIDLYLYDWE